MQHLEYVPIIRKFVKFTRKNFKNKHIRFFRKTLTRKQFLKEFATIKIAGTRRSGHTIAAVTLGKEDNAFCIVPFPYMRKSWDGTFINCYAISDLEDLIDYTDDFLSNLVVIDCASWNPNSIDYVYHYLALQRSLPKDLVIVQLG